MKVIPILLIVLLTGNVGFLSLCQAQSAQPGAKVSRVYIVPVDILTRGASVAVPGEAPADPFTGPKPTAQTKARCPEFPRVVPALGDQHPIDARRVFEDLGATFAEGDVALYHPRRTRAVLFVRTGKESQDLIERILSPAFEDFIVKTVRYTWLLTEKDRRGKTRTLLERTFLCRAGQRAKFERHSSGRLVEMIECETTVGEDGITVDLNNAVELHLKDLDIKVTNQALLHSGDPAVLYTGRGSRRGSTVELRIAGDVIRGIPSRDWKSPDSSDHLTALAAQIDQQLRDLEKGGGREKVMLSDLFYMAPWFGKKEQGKAPWRETSLAQFKAQRIMDAREALRQANVELEKDDAAWYAPESRLLYIRAGVTGRMKVAGMLERVQPFLLPQAEVQLAPSSVRKGKVRDLPLRSLIVRGQQQARAESKTKDGVAETVEIEYLGGEGDEAADLDLKLTNFAMDGEVWSLATKTYTATDGNLPVSLVSGRAADTGGALKSLILTAKPIGDEWLQLAADPVRRKAAIAEFEAALNGPQRSK